MKGIAIHCSESEFGSSILIDEWHRERGWDNIGYHFVIPNGQVENNHYLACMDGTIERGRDIHKEGAHVEGYNDWIGIVLMGRSHFTPKQFISLKVLVSELMVEYSIKKEMVWGHYEFPGVTKTCPNFDVAILREQL
jgi:N-acetyl-anhydromuramyl-L-alanine amidase AmpD